MATSEECVNTPSANESRPMCSDADNPTVPVPVSSANRFPSPFPCPPLPSPLLSRQRLSSLLLSPLLSARWYLSSPAAAAREILSGAAVAVMLVPESVAFGFLGNVSPLVGLYSTFFIGLIAAAFGGKPAMISGMAGALMVVAAEFMKDDGALSGYSYADRFQHFLLIVIIMGVLQVVAGFIGLSYLLRLVPRPVHVGFVNALAIVIFMAQFESFQVCDTTPFFSCTHAQKRYVSLRDGSAWLLLVHVFSTMLMVYLVPKIPRIGKVVPSTLVALIICTIFEHLINRKFIGWDTRTVGETAEVMGPLPTFVTPTRPAAGWDLRVVFQYAFMLGTIGIVESLMAIQALNQVTKSPQNISQCHQECVAQGIGNILASLFGSVGGSILIGESAVNILTGARGRLSGITSALCILFTVIFAGPAIALIPIGALTGILFIAIIKTFDWATFKTIPRIPISDTVLIVAVTVLGVVTNLAIAVAAGVLLAATIHAWKVSSTLIIDEVSTSDTSSTLRIRGPLLFATAWKFEGVLLEKMPSSPADVLLDFADSSVSDYSGLHSIYKLVKEYKRGDKALRLINIDDQSLKVLARSGKMINKGASVVFTVAHLEEDREEPSAVLGALQGSAAPPERDSPTDIEVLMPLSDRGASTDSADLP